MPDIIQLTLCIVKSKQKSINQTVSKGHSANYSIHIKSQLHFDPSIVFSARNISAIKLFTDNSFPFLLLHYSEQA
ncbi:hypothetical protein D3C81_1751640 [compost metagenome]